MRLRPYKSCDAEAIAAWLQDEDVFQKWGGARFGEFPIDAATIDNKYRNQNGDCAEDDNFYPWTAVDEANRPVGHFIMRYVNGDVKQVRFGWVIVDSSIRGRGYGRTMLEMGLRYAFDFLRADRVTIGVFEQNDIAHDCYRRVGFTDVGTVPGTPWNVVEMEAKRV